MTAFPGSSDQNGPLIALTQEPCVDERGEIRNLLDVPFTSVAVITSVKGAVRGNHYHKTDYHYCWLQRGAGERHVQQVADLAALVQERRPR